MRVAIAVVPGVIVVVPDVPWDEPVEHLGEVPHQSRLVLDGGQATRRAYAEQQHLPLIHSYLVNHALHVPSYVYHFRIAAGLYRQSFCPDPAINHLYTPEVGGNAGR